MGGLSLPGDQETPGVEHEEEVLGHISIIVFYEIELDVALGWTHANEHSDRVNIGDQKQWNAVCGPPYPPGHITSYTKRDLMTS